MKKEDSLRNAPISAFEKARFEWFERYGSSVMGSNRLFILAVILAVATIAQSLAIFVMMPLKTVQPYVVKVSDDGQATATSVGTVAYQPGDAEKRYFLADWVTKLLTLDKYMTENNLVAAFYRTRNKGSSEFSDWVDQNKPAEALNLDPSLTRAVAIRSISFIGDGAALVRASLETRTSAQSAQMKKNVIVTIHYALIPPTTEKEILENPIGLYITHFAINEDSN